MARRIRFFSDDSYITSGHRRFHAVVAGVAIEAERQAIREQLIEAERISGKHLADWHQVHSASIRQRYVDAVFKIEALRGRVFFRAYGQLASDEKWHARVDTLTRAIATYTPGRCFHAVLHEGLTPGSRRQLRFDLSAGGCERVTVEAAQFRAYPEVRLADAMAGFVRGELYGRDGRRLAFSLPDWFVDLSA